MADLDFDALIAVARQAIEQIEYHRAEIARHAQIRNKTLDAARAQASGGSSPAVAN